jgi:hypothetical protein
MFFTSVVHLRKKKDEVECQGERWIVSTVHDMEGERNVDPVWGRRQRISGERGFVMDLPQGGLSQKRIEEMYSREPRLRPRSIQRLVTCIPNEEVDCLASLLLRISL